MKELKVFSSVELFTLKYFQDFIKFSGSVFFTVKPPFWLSTPFYHIALISHVIVHCQEYNFFMTKYYNMLESNQSLKLLILLLLCQPCRYEYYSIIDYCHFAIFCFLYITFISTFASLLSNRKCQHICFCL